MAVVQLRNVSKAFAGRPAVADVSFSVAEGETVALVGESGCGKTTTLKMINRLIEPDSGELMLFGEPAEAAPAPLLRRRIGYVFQEIGLFPHLTVAENIGITPALLGWDKARIAARVDALLDMVRLGASRRGAMPGELSGGQRQRVAIARALASQPSLLLMDEAFGALDPLTRHDLRSDLKAIQAEAGFAIVLVTHDMAEAAILGDRILVMQEGRVLQDAAPAELIARPADDYVAHLLAAPEREAAAFAAARRGHG